MAKPPFRLDRKGVGEVLKGTFTAQINELAEKLADEVRATIADDSVPVEMEAYTTDRGAAMVTIADARGLELQATQGALTRAAAKVGLEVKGLS